MTHRRRQILSLVTLLLSVASSAAARQQPQTRPERSAYRETSRYEDVIAFLDALPRSRVIHRTTMGYTTEGRALPLVVVGRLPNGSAEAVRRSGLTRVYIQANIHAGEVEGKEAALMLLRDLASGRNARWLDSLVVIVAPIYNADGNERIALTNRPLQHGPVGGMGQRPNAQGLDLNRDHIKLESPEARSQVAMLNAYDPHVMFDLHTTNGSIHAYHLTYSQPQHPMTDRAIVDLLTGEWLPQVTRIIRERDGWDMFYYGNLPAAPVDRGGGGAERGWYSFDHRPRFSNNYWGLRNRFGILSEAYSYATFEERIRATYRFVQESLEFARANAGRLRSMTEAADRRSIVGDSVAVRARLHRGPDIEVLIGGVTIEPNPYTGQPMRLRTTERRAERMADFSTFEASEMVRAPRAYLVPESLTTVIERLTAHGIQISRAEGSTSVERFRIDSTFVTAREFQGHRERTVVGRWESAGPAAGAAMMLVPVNQPLGRLVVMMLEPRSDDGLLNWNAFDPAIERAQQYPIQRVM